MTRTTYASNLYLALIVTLAGCGDTNGSPTGVDPSKNLAALTEAERQKLCDHEHRSAAATQQDSCLIATLSILASVENDDATTDASAQAACEAVYNDCITVFPDADASSAPCEPFTESCSATVGEYEACLGDISAAQAIAAAGMPQCSDLTVSYLQEAAPSLDSSTEPVVSAVEGPSCETFLDKCPEGSD